MNMELDEKSTANPLDALLAAAMAAADDPLVRIWLEKLQRGERASQDFPLPRKGTDGRFFDPSPPDMRIVDGGHPVFPYDDVKQVLSRDVKPLGL